ELVEPSIQRIEALVHRIESPIHGCESLVDDGKALVDGVETLIDARKALTEESDELRILGRGHVRSLPHGRGAFKCVYSWTVGDPAEFDLDPRAAPNAARGARQELGDPHLQAVLRAKRGARPVDHLGLRDQPACRGLPWALDAAPAVRGRDLHSGCV